MSFSIVVSRIAVAGALLVASVAVGSPASVPVSAGPNSGMCAYTTARGAILDGFPLDACFDGSTLFIDNRTNIPLYVSFEGASGSSSRSGLDATPPLASRAFMETHSQEPGLLMPGYRIQVPVGSGAFKATLEGTNHNRSYPLVRWLTEWFPGVSSIDTFIGSANELVQVYDQHISCLDRNGWLGDIGCEALYYRNVGFALGRFGVNVGSDLLGGALSLLSTAQWTTETATEVKGIVEGVHTIELAAAPVVTPATTPGPVVTPAPTQPPVGTVALVALSFSVTGTCTSAGGVLGSSSRNFSPGGRYTIQVWYPNGSSYTALSLGSSGTVRSDGTVAWQWDCTGDPAGTYTTELVDSATGRSSGRIGFAIGSVPVPATTAAPLQPVTFAAQQASRGANTFSDPSGATGQGARIEPNTWVQVSCKIKPASTIASAYPDGYWYRIASAPWNNQFYAVANTFWNGDTASTPREQWHNTDMSIPDC